MIVWPRRVGTVIPGPRVHGVLGRVARYAVSLTGGGLDVHPSWVPRYEARSMASDPDLVVVSPDELWLLCGAETGRWRDAYARDGRHGHTAEPRPLCQTCFDSIREIGHFHFFDCREDTPLDLYCNVRLASRASTCYGRFEIYTPWPTHRICWSCQAGIVEAAEAFLRVNHGLPAWC